MRRRLLMVRNLWMRKRILVSTILLLVVVLIGSSSYAVAQQLSPKEALGTESDHELLSSSGSCGVERWSVKTGTDADVGLINLQSTTQTTIASLRSLPAPSNLPANNRIQPTETTVFQLQATLVEYKLESDSDYHLVIKDGSGNTMITEIPDPLCVGSSSPLKPGIQNARAEFDARYTPNGNFQTANVPVTVRGVGFFDFLHGQTGVAPNGIELHAVLDVQFGTGGTPTPPPTPTPTSCTPPPTNNLIQNGGFEVSGNWTYAGQSHPARTTAQAHSGSYSLKAGLSSGQQGDSIAYQMVTVPGSSTCATLSFYYWPASNDNISYAWQEADVINSSGQVVQQLFRTLSNTRNWTQSTFNLSQYAGQTIGIQFLDHELSNGQSFYAYMYVDDVTLMVN